jgi:hypothetical protein
MSEDRVRCDLLLAAQFTVKCHVQRLTGVALVSNRRANAEVW